MTGSPISHRDLTICVAVVAVLSVASLAGLPEWLGAHPWWAIRSGIIGSGAGALAYLILRLAGRSAGFILSIGAGCLVASTVAAVIGKRVFAAPLAENALAGRVWFFGWFAVSACLAVILIGIIRRSVSR